MAASAVPAAAVPREAPRPVLPPPVVVERASRLVQVRSRLLRDLPPLPLLLELRVAVERLAEEVSVRRNRRSLSAAMAGT